MTSDRSYRKALPCRSALPHIYEEISESFMPRIAVVFVKKMTEYLAAGSIFPDGALVRLHTGEIAEVLHSEKNRKFFPLIGIYRDIKQEPLRFPVKVSLDSDLTRYIRRSSNRNRKEKQPTA